MFPNDDKEIKLTSFVQIIENFLHYNNLKPRFCNSENEAREICKKNDFADGWPVYIFESDTTGEKPFEEFYSQKEEVLKNNFDNLSSVYYSSNKNDLEINEFIKQMEHIYKSQSLTRLEIIKIFSDFIDGFQHIEKDKFLNQRM